MMRLPVKCPDCDSIFLSRSYNFGGHVSSWGNIEPCIYCGRDRALLSEGVFRISEDIIEILQYSDATKQNFRELIAIAEKLKANLLTVEQAAEQADHIKSGWGDYLKSWSKADVIAACALLFAAFAWFDTKQATSENSDQMERLIAAVEQNQSPGKNTKPNATRSTPTENRKARRRADALKRKTK